MVVAIKNFVTYLRVSTQAQGNSGLGLEAQRAAVTTFLKGRAGNLVHEYVEVESGKNDSRVQLAAAIAHAKRVGAVLLIAKLDRLSRNVSFIFQLKDSGVQFVCADLPDANTLTVGIFAVIAQNERETIAKRTKDALAAKRERGEKLGTPHNLTGEGRAKGVEAIKANAVNNKANVQARQLSAMLWSSGMSLTKIANYLNISGYLTRRGCSFTPTAVKRLLDVSTSLQPSAEGSVSELLKATILTSRY